MSKHDELIAVYTQDLEEECGEANPDMGFSAKVAINSGPLTYNDDASKVSGSGKAESDRAKQDFLIKKLGLTNSPELGKAIEAVIERYGKSNRNKHRAVVYCLLAKHFKEKSVYNK